MIPRRTLPPNALVIALSPLLDQRSVGALLDLRARGYDLAVIDVSPVPFIARPQSGLDAVAYDIWALRRDALRHRLQRAGVAVAEWQRRDGPCNPSWRRCGNSGATPGTRASDHRAAGARRARRGDRVRDRRPRAARARSRSASARSASPLLALGIVLRWPSLVPWAIVLASAAATWAAARAGTSSTAGRRRSACCCCWPPSSRPGRSSTTRASAAERALTVRRIADARRARAWRAAHELPAARHRRDLGVRERRPRRGRRRGRGRCARRRARDEPDRRPRPAPFGRRRDTRLR